MKDPQGGGRPNDPWIGRQLGSYRLTERIGRGGQGVVYRAEHAQLAGVMAAIKVLRSDAPDDLGAGRLQREAMALQRLNHPHVVRFLDYGIEDEHQWLAMDFIDGESLWARVHRDGPLAPDEAVRVVGEVLDALGAAHDLGLLHRDIKPENVLFRSGDGRALLTDFGLAKGSTLGPSLSASGLIYGTPTYIPPEVWQGERADERSDLWSMGVLACQLATGELPFHISDARAASHVVCTKSPDLSRLTDPRLRHFVSRCLAKRRDRRPESAAAAKALLEGGFTGRQVARPRPPATAWIAAVAAVLVITAVTLGAWRPWEIGVARGGSDGGASGPPKLAGASEPQGTPSGDGASADPAPPADRPVSPVPGSDPEQDPPEDGPLDNPLAALAESLSADPLDVDALLRALEGPAAKADPAATAAAVQRDLDAGRLGRALEQLLPDLPAAKDPQLARERRRADRLAALVSGEPRRVAVARRDAIDAETEARLDLAGLTTALNADPTRLDAVDLALRRLSATLRERGQALVAAQLTPEALTRALRARVPQDATLRVLRAEAQFAQGFANRLAEPLRRLVADYAAGIAKRADGIAGWDALRDELNTAWQSVAVPAATDIAALRERLDAVEGLAAAERQIWTEHLADLAKAARLHEQLGAQTGLPKPADWIAARDGVASLRDRVPCFGALNRRFQDVRDAVVKGLVAATNELATALDDPSVGRARLQEFDARAAALACRSERDWTTARQALMDRIAALEKPPEPDVRVLEWAETLVAMPDPKIVTSADLRGRIEATGLPWKVRGKQSGIELVLVPPGEYLRGASPGDDMAQDDEKPRHRVKITQAFYLGVTEVTNAQYRRKVGGHDSKAYEGVGLNGDRQPAVYVSWTAAQGFCEAFDGLRLPTEGEWEYAARACGEIARRYPWGDDLEGGAAYANVADQAAKRSFSSWTVFPFDDGVVGTADVGQFRANALGLHDMTGNVWEWCSDWYGSNEYGRYGARPAEDPKGPANGERRALRGGSWDYGPAFARLSDRFFLDPDSTYYFVGFRVARTP